MSSYRRTRVKEEEGEEEEFGREKDEDTSICSRGEDESQRGFRRIGKGKRDIQIS